MTHGGIHKDAEMNTPEAIAERISQNLGLQVYDELDKVKGEPRLQIFVVHGYLELTVDIIVKHRLKNQKKILGDTRSYSYATKILILNELGVISDSEYRVLDWFRKLRNRAAHESIFKIKKEDLQVLKQNHFHDPQNFDKLSFALINLLWNTHKDILYPIFFPRIP